MTQGCFIECLKHLFKILTNQELRYHFYGKPTKETYLFAKDSLLKISEKNEIENIIAIGDNPL
jgi:ribonucleotide monophosphatase NagD (HAD superfamily)